MISEFIPEEGIARFEGNSALIELGARIKTDLDAVEYAKKIIQEGAAGVVYGRNAFQAKNPKKFLDALIKVVKEEREPEEVVDVG